MSLFYLLQTTKCSFGWIFNRDMERLMLKSRDSFHHVGLSREIIIFSSSRFHVSLFSPLWANEYWVTYINWSSFHGADWVRDLKFSWNNVDKGSWTWLCSSLCAIRALPTIPKEYFQREHARNSCWFPPGFGRLTQSKYCQSTASGQS